jgi:hypothetical protein
MIIGAVVGALLGTGGQTFAAIDCNNPPPNYQLEDITKPMRFYRPEADACLGNAVNEPYLAVGTITESTPQTFQEFARNNVPGSAIEFISPGGNLLAAL